MINTRTIITATVLGLVMLAAIIQLIQPAPRIADYCSSPVCHLQAVDILVVKNEDYRGLLFKIVGLGMVLGLATVVVSFFSDRNSHIILSGNILLLDSLLYGFGRHWLFPFGDWPTQTWSAVVIVAVLCSILLIVQQSRQLQKHVH